MVEYKCLLCSFKTTFTTNYKKHLKSKKHLANEQNQKGGQKSIESKLNPIESLKKFECKFCYKVYSSNSNLHKHLKKCSKINIDLEKNESKMNPNESKMNPIESKNALFCTQNAPFCTQNAPFCTQNAPFWVHETIDDNRSEKEKKIIDNKTCQYCNKTFTRTTGLKKHLITCKEKKKKEDYEFMKKKLDDLSEKNLSLTNNIQNNKINTQNNGTINYLNINFGNVQPMEQFIENFKTKYKLTDRDRKCLLNTYNECDIGLFSDTFFHMMKKYLIKQIDSDILPTIPMVCTDSNLRSVKEYHKDVGWKTTQSNKCIDQMIDISNNQIYESENTMMYMNQKQRNKIYTRMKQENSLLSMESEKKEFELEKNFKIDKLDTMEEKCKYNIDNNVEQSEDESNKIKEMDFSIINDELIEKYSAPNAPKLIT